MLEGAVRVEDAGPSMEGPFHLHCGLAGAALPAGIPPNGMRYERRQWA